MKLIKKLKDLNLSTKIVLIITAVCILVLGSSYLVLQSSHQAYDEQLYKSTAQLVASIADQVEMQLSKIDMATLAITNNGGVQESLRVMDVEEAGSLTWLNAKRQLTNDLYNFMYSIEYFYGFVIIASEGTVVGNSSNVCSSGIMEELVQRVEEKNEPSAVICQDGNVYYLRQIVNQDGDADAHLGIMVARVNMLKLMNDCEALYEQANIGLDISVFAEDSLIYSPNHARVEQLEADGWQIRDKHFVVQCTSSQGWKFLFCSSYDKIHSAIEEAERRSMGLAALVAILALLGSCYIVRRFAAHLETLMKKIDAYGKGVLPAAREMAKYQDRQDEFGRLHRHFDRMAYDYKELSDANYEHLLLEKEVQYKQLQQQIQPHFIYNTLALISGIAYEHGDNEIASLTISFSQLLRASMNINEKAVPLREELALTENYIHIQTKRFGTRLQYKSDIPEEMLQVSIPQFTVQPLVENAIKYALEEMLDNCHVNVYGYVEGETAVIVVEDNGPGIDPQILQKLETKEFASKGHGIGLRNIQKRIQLLFTEKYGLRVLRREDTTQIQIRVPYHQQPGIDQQGASQ